MYHSGKVNMVVDALSWKVVSMGSLALLLVLKRSLAMDVQSLANRLVRLDIFDPERIFACIKSRSSLAEQIRGR